MTADTTATSEVAGGAGVTAAGKGFFYQPLAFATLHGQADLVTVLNDTLRTLRGDGTLRRLSLHWYRGLDVGVRPAGVPSFTAALACSRPAPTRRADVVPAPSGDSARRVEPIVPARRWEVLSSDELDRLREAVFAVLADVGVRFPLPRALDVLAAHGAAVDRSRDRRPAAASARRGGPGERAARVHALRPRALVRPAPRRPPLLPVQRRQRRLRDRSRERRAARRRPWPTWPHRRASATRCLRSPSTGGRSSPPATCRSVRALCTRRRPCSPTRPSTSRP